MDEIGPAPFRATEILQPEPRNTGKERPGKCLTFQESNYLCRDMRLLVNLFGFLPLSMVDILDILMVGLIIYFLIRLIRNSSAMNIFLALIFLLLVQAVVSALGMKMMSSIMNTLLDVGVLALIVIFQPEIRHFLNRIGSQTGITRRTSDIFNRLLGIKDDKMGNAAVQEITEACRSMSEQYTGALIVFPHKTSLDYIVETGDRIDADINRRLIMNLFFKNSPLHDGAIIIGGNRIIAARCTLPITQRTDIPPQMGMRHKAAIGISEETDADVIVVSEETGGISFVSGGKVTHINNINELKLLLGGSLS